MAYAPRRSCSSPGCRTLCEEGAYCPKHRVQTRRQRDEDRGTSSARGYDADHRKLRVLCFKRDQWRCVDCGWEPNLVALYRQSEMGAPPVDGVLEELRERLKRGERHLHADHQIPIAVRPELRLDLENLRTRCNRCHNSKTRRETAG